MNRPRLRLGRFNHLRLGARSLATRLRLASLVERASLRDVLATLTPGDVEAAPLAVVENAIALSEQIAAKLRVPDTCLYRSLARYAALRRAGHAARFVMALDPAANDIVGHAWVELDGSPIGEEIEPGLAVTFSYPGS